jgi:hypothetical protein
VLVHCEHPQLLTVQLYKYRIVMKDWKQLEGSSPVSPETPELRQIQTKSRLLSRSDGSDVGAQPDFGSESARSDIELTVRHRQSEYLLY